MPQNPEVPVTWQKMLGPDWQSVWDTWLHRLGNITLTGYNSSYKDKSFADKKTAPNGFLESSLHLNRFIREQERWTAIEMERRGKSLALKALGLWPALEVDMEAVKASELEERKAVAARYKLEDLPFDKESRLLFELLRPELLALGEDVIELCGSKSVTYRVYDWFLEVVPRKHRLSLLLNLDFEDCEDPAGKAVDATEFAFIVNAAEIGAGVVFRLESEADIGPALHVVKQAYERVSE
jgi:predicted transport protein